MNDRPTSPDLEKWEIVTFFLSKTPRVQEVLLEFMNATNNQEVAAKLNIEPNTVSQHITQACKELKLHQKFSGFSSKQISYELKILLRKYLNDIVTSQIYKALSIKKNNRNVASSERSRRGKIVITLDLNYEEVDDDFILRFLREMQRFFGNDRMRIEKIEDGSLKLTISGTVEACERLKSLFDTGELTEILNTPVLDISSIETEPEDNLWSWLQSNIVPGWELEETVSATIAAFKSHPDFSNAPVFGAQMSADGDVELDIAIAELLPSLNSQDLDLVLLAAQRLGELEVNSLEVINALKQKLKAVDDVETKWQIALALGKIAPEEYPNAKAHKQTVELGNSALAIVLGIKNNEDNFVDILGEIRPDWDDYLPTGLEVKILEESGENFWQDEFICTQSVADEQAYIYFSFWGTPGDKFILQLTLEDAILQKHFQI